MKNNNKLDHSRRYAAPITERDYVPTGDELAHAIKLHTAPAAAKPPRYKLRVVVDEETGKPVYVAKCCKLPLVEEKEE